MTKFTNPASAAGEAAGEYIAAVLELLGDRSPVDVLDHTAEALRDMVRGVSPGVLGRPEAAGRWSTTAVIAHLADSELVWSNRLRFVLAEDRPQFIGYDQDLWADRLGYSERDANEELNLFEAVRASNLALIARASETDLLRVGVHPERGEESVEHMLRLYAGHDLVHLAQARRILGSMSVNE
ncbi:MAG: DinB family protein [Gemmatimonadota bacterium]|nr:DinB family protein [Gemmatimonadota bacterium]